MRVAILTDLREFHDGYSLTHVVRDQLRMLKRYGHDATLFVSEDFSGEPNGFKLNRMVLNYSRQAYDSETEISAEDKAKAEVLGVLLANDLKDYDIVFTHDWIFAPRKMPLAKALHVCASGTRKQHFYHWMHSVPSGCSDWWNIRRYGPNHKLVYPNSVDAPLVADLFHGDASDVMAIPHIVDLRSLFGFSSETRSLIDTFPGLLQADFCQVYPVARDRLSDKGLRNLIFLFKNLKARGASVCLLIADSWTGYGEPEDLHRYKSLATGNGLTQDEFAFLSEFGFPSFVPHKTLMELQQCATLCAFPSRGESFGLIATEAMLAGGVLPVLNKSVSAMQCVSGGNGLFLPFGSAEKGHAQAGGNEREFNAKLASLVIGAAMNDQSWRARVYARKNLNMDTIYRRYYEPILSEAI